MLDQYIKIRTLNGTELSDETKYLQGLQILKIVRNF